MKLVFIKDSLSFRIKEYKPNHSNKFSYQDFNPKIITVLFLFKIKTDLMDFHLITKEGK